MSRIREKLAGGISAPADKKAMSSFAGRWFTTFGVMELSQDGSRVDGFYEFQAQRCAIEGTIREGRLHFTYQEPTVAGEGWFELV